MKRLLLSAIAALVSFSIHAMPVMPSPRISPPVVPVSPAQMTTDTAASSDTDDVAEFDPYAADALDTLAAFDEAYRAQTGEETLFNFASPFSGLLQQVGGCFRGGCHIFANVVKAQQPMQLLYLYIDGVLDRSWPVSTARAPRVTPNFDGHPSGPFYPGRYDSKKYPGGDYHGLGNMPYATFYNGGFAIHGTPSISQLGRPASHGCVRSHPDNAHYFSQLVRATGGAGVWITVSQERVAPTAEPGPLSLR